MLNALKYTEELERVGFSREQADTSVRILVEVMNESFATKADLKELATATKADFKELATATKADFKVLEFKIDSVAAKSRSDLDAAVARLESTIRESEYKIIIKLGTLLGSLTTIAVGVTATLVKLLSTGH